MAMVAVLGMTAALSAEASAPVAAAAAVAAPVATVAAAAPAAPAMSAKEQEFASKLDAAHKKTFEAMSADARKEAMENGCKGANGCKAKDCNAACDAAAKKRAAK